MPHRRDGSSALGCGAEAGQRGQRSREEVHVVESALFSLFQLLHVRDDLGARGFKSVLRTFQDVSMTTRSFQDARSIVCSEPRAY